MIIQYDALEELMNFPDNSVDAVVTDPPYGLSFMGKKWDYDVPSVELWKECLRVLKPGAFLLSFAGTRTYHRMAVNIEDAGFEIRDMISWLYGSGFPKSLNIGKQVDKIQGNEREFVGKENYSMPKADNTIQASSYGISGGSLKNGVTAERIIPDITKGTSGWEGFGTALKPACEPIVVARKPLSEKNVALNCLKWGTGGINIDDCRISHNEPEKLTNRIPRVEDNVFSDDNCGFKKENTHLASASQQGRFPANILLDEEAGKILDEQSGISKSKKFTMGRGFDDSEVFGTGDLNYKSKRGHNDKGGASRFFYCAKASKSERNLGCEELPKIKKVFNGQHQKSSKDMKDVEKRWTTLPKQNNHPTVKPIKLMEYLVKLVSRKGSIVLDPFLGSGTTAIACEKLDRKWIGIEREADYIKIANARIKLFVKKEDEK